MRDNWLHGIGIAGYRSFDEQPQFIGPLSKINLVLGANNSGKSNILRFLFSHYEKAYSAICVGREPLVLSPSDDLYKGNSNSTVEIFLALLKKQNFIDPVLKLAKNDPTRRLLQEFIEKSTALNLNDDSIIWLGRTVYGSVGPMPPERFEANLSDQDIYSKQLLLHHGFSHLANNLAHALGGLGGRSDEANTMRKVTAAIAKHIPKVPDIRMIPAVRYIATGRGEWTGKKNDKSIENMRVNDGMTLIDSLFAIQNPPAHTHQEDRESFEKIQGLVRDVVGDQSLSIHIPHDKETINVHADGRILQIDDLGTGIRQLIIIASLCTIWKNALILIEEPETNLHPILQRKLIHYLASNTDNQYMIASHSSSMIDGCDIVDAKIFQVYMQQGVSRVKSVVESLDASKLARDLGYRPSDLLQANCVIWVEGPSDRVYINKWIQTLDGSLREGIEYSIMFYGGDLLSHLSASDSLVVDEFVRLLRINRFCAVVMDSDRRYKNAPISDAKKRVKKELNEIDGLAWVTSGREIENYFTEMQRDAAIIKIHPRSKYKVKRGVFEEGLPRKKKPDKVRISKSLAEDVGIPDNLSLKRSLKKLISFIEKANKLDV